MDIQLPIKAHSNNLLLTQENDVWAYYSIAPANVSRHNPLKRAEANEQTAELLKSLAGYTEIELFGYPENLNMRSKVKKMSTMFAKDSEEIAEHYMENMVSILEAENGLIYQSAYVLGVKLADGSQTDGLVKAVKLAGKKVTIQLMGMLGYELEDVDELFQQVKNIEQDLFTLISTYSGTRLKDREMIYLVRQQFIRNQIHEIENENQYPSVLEASSAVIDSGSFKKTNGETVNGLLKIESETGSSYLKILPVYDLPVDMTGIDLFRFAEEQRFPVEFRMKIRYGNSTRTGLKLHFIEGKLQEEEKNAYTHGDELSKKNIRHQFLAKTLRDEDEDNEPLLEYLGCFIIYGKTPEETLERSQGLEKILKGVKVSRATADQMRLFYQLLLGKSLEERNWINYSNAESVGESAFATAEFLGMQSGFYIGRIDNVGATQKNQTVQDLVLYSSRYVWLNPLAIAEGIAGALYDTPHIAITGKSGKGKTFLAGLLFLYSQFLDVQTLFIDPKGEKRKAFEDVMNDPYYQHNYPLFCDMLKRFHYVTLNAEDERNFGVLDPFVFQTRKEEILTTVDDMLKELLPELTGHEEAKVSNAITRACEEVFALKQKGNQVGAFMVVEQLAQDEDEIIKEYGTYLFNQIRSTNMRLAFSYGENKGLDFSQRVSILEIQDLKLPDKDTQSLTKEDKRSLALMIALSRFCVKFGSRDKNQNTSIFFTEAWTLSKSQNGSALIEEMGRIGRSYKNQMVLDTQFVHDILSEDGTGNFGLLFCFDEETDRENILRLLGLEVNQMNLDEMKHMIKGQCWFRDTNGEVGKLNVHCPFEEIVEALKTVNKTVLSEIEEMNTSSV
ncbi:MAG: ATP-binding protein [Streptococcaceae bacterium]|jgi:hypothetical protein|nr:ATP-binding protein [Streptococcaceae bacterium]